MPSQSVGDPVNMNVHTNAIVSERHSILSRTGEMDYQYKRTYSKQLGESKRPFWGPHREENTARRLFWEHLKRIRRVAVVQSVSNTLVA